MVKLQGESIYKKVWIYFKHHWWDLVFGIPACFLFAVFFPDLLIASIGIALVLFLLSQYIGIKPRTQDMVPIIIFAFSLLLISYDVTSSVLFTKWNLIRRIIFAVASTLLASYAFLLIVHLINRFRSAPKIYKFLEQTVLPRINDITETMHGIDENINSSILSKLDTLMGQASGISRFQYQLLSRLLASHALFTDDCTLENILQIIGKRSSKVKWAMARMVSEALSKVFVTKTHFELPGQTYREFSDMFNSCIHFSDTVWLTCIYSPMSWFQKLKGAPHDYWQNINDESDLNLEIDLSDLNLDRLKQFTDDETDIYRYPAHYVSFLRTKTRVRIFLLEPNEWGKLRSDKDAFEKFMRPCRSRKVETLFVNISQFSSWVNGFTNKISNNDLLRNQDISNLDLDIFDKQACMEWDKSGTIKFVFEGPLLDAYVQLFDFILKRAHKERRKAEEDGIYTSDRITEILA